jgi:hypothetical protein
MPDQHKLRCQIAKSFADSFARPAMEISFRQSLTIQAEEQDIVARCA